MKTKGKKKKQLGSSFWLPFIHDQGVISMVEKIHFDKREKKIYSTQKKQLDNFKGITTQTNILFELFNQYFLKQINKIRSKQLFYLNLLNF